MTKEDYYIQIAKKEGIKLTKPEEIFQAQAVKLLQLYNYTVMRVNSSAKISSTGSYLRSYIIYGRGKHSSSGFTDLICFKGENFITIEVKSRTGKSKESQKLFQKYWEERGHKYYKAKTLYDIIKIIRSYNTDN